MGLVPKRKASSKPEGGGGPPSKPRRRPGPYYPPHLGGMTATPDRRGCASRDGSLIRWNEGRAPAKISDFQGPQAHFSLETRRSAHRQKHLNEPDLSIKTKRQKKQKPKHILASTATHPRVRCSVDRRTGMALHSKVAVCFKSTHTGGVG